MFKLFRTVSACLTVCLISHTVEAEQLSFRRLPADGDTRFEYRWLDHDDKPREIKFILPKDSTNMLPVQQVNYNPELALRNVEVALLSAARELDPKEARFSLTKRHDKLEFSVTGRNDQRVNEITQSLKNTQEKAYNDYLDERYFQRYKTPLLVDAIKPDHVRYIEESILPLVPLAQSLYENVDEQSNARSYLNLLLSWSQAIPYDELTNRVTSNGSGYSPPLAVINQNLGDCDSKSVLTAALIRAFLPSNSMRLVLLNNHALLAIAMTPLTKDTTMMIDGIPFILFDPTGPAPLPFGEVSKTTQQAIASRQYTLEVIPPAVGR